MKDSQNNIYIEKYLSYLRSHKYSKKTVNGIQQFLEHLMIFFSKKLGKNFLIQNIRLRDLEGYIRYFKEEKKLSPFTLAGRVGNLRKYFSYLTKEGIVFLDPTEELKSPKLPKKLPDVPTVEEINQFIQAIDVTTLHGMRDRTMVEILYGCGLRIAELMGMSIFSVDFQSKTIRITGKGNKERIVPVGKKTIDFIKKYLRDIRPKLLKNSEYQEMWISVRARPFFQSSFGTIINDYWKKSKLTRNITCHSLRRAFATHMLQNGAHPIHIQHMLGHESIATLSSYIRLTITDIKKMHKKSKPGQ